MGRVSFRLVFPRKYRLVVRFIGYEEAMVDAVEEGHAPLGLEEIALLIGEETLQEVVVSGDKMLMRHQVDRQVYSSGDFQVSVGGTATDLLKNLPSMSLNAEGELSVRGTSGFVILDEIYTLSFWFSAPSGINKQRKMINRPLKLLPL